MAESDPIKRMKAAARRSAGPVSVEIQRDWYLNELEEDLGRDPTGNWRYDASKPQKLSIWTVLIGLTVLLTIVFGITIAIFSWRAGVFDSWLPPVANPSTEQRKWVLGDAETGRPSPQPTGKAQASDAPPNLIEPIINPPRPAPEPDPIPEAEE